MPIWKACIAFKSVILTQQTDQQLPGVGGGRNGYREHKGILGKWDHLVKLICMILHSEHISLRYASGSLPEELMLNLSPLRKN